MSIASALGLSSDPKGRYAVVGLGHLSQEAMLPGIAHTGNSAVVALVTGVPLKPREAAQRYDVANHRAKNGMLPGPLFDMGPYPINAARYLFGDEPAAVVSATATRHPEAGFGDLDDTVAVTLRFPGSRLARCIVTDSANAIGTLLVAGTRGSMPVHASGPSRD